MPYFLFMLVVLVLSWGMMLNISKLLCDRIALQNAADNAALSAAVNHARAINLIAKINSMMAKLLYNGSISINTDGWAGVYPETLGTGGGEGQAYGICILVPVSPQAIRNNVSRIASSIDIVGGGYAVCIFGTKDWFTGNRDCERTTGVKTIQGEMTLLNGIQEGIFLIGPANCGKIARYIAKKQGTGPKIGLEDETVEMGFFRNTLELSAANVDLFFREGNEYITGALSLGLKKNTQKIEYFGARHYGLTVPPVPPSFPGKHLHYVYPFKIGDNLCTLHNRYESWYYADEASFYRKKIGVCVRKKAGSYERERYPKFGKWIGIEWPDMMASASASTYNRTVNNHGRPSFVLKRSPWKGTEIKENIDAYDDSRKGGWYAHLVPSGGTLH